MLVAVGSRDRVPVFIERRKVWISSHDVTSLESGVPNETKLSGERKRVRWSDPLGALTATERAPDPARIAMAAEAGDNHDPSGQPDMEEEIGRVRDDCPSHVSVRKRKHRRL